MGSIDILLTLFSTNVNIGSGALVLVPRHEIRSTNFVYDVSPYIRTSDVSERGKEYLIVVL